MSQQDGSSGASAPSEAGPPQAVGAAASLDRITHQLEDFDRSLLDLTTGLETLHQHSENTNTLLNHILLQQERDAVIRNGENRSLLNSIETSNRNAQDAATTAHNDAQRQAEGHILTHQRIIAAIAPEIKATQAANIAEAVTLLRDLFGDVLTTKLWGFPFWLGIFLTLLMVVIKSYEMKGQMNIAGAMSGSGGSETMGRIDTILARNPGWKKLLEEPRVVLDNFLR